MKAFLGNLVLAAAETFKVKPPENDISHAPSADLTLDKSGNVILPAEVAVQDSTSTTNHKDAADEAALILIENGASPTDTNGQKKLGVAIAMQTSPVVGSGHGCFRGKGGWSLGVQTCVTGVSLSFPEGDDYEDGLPKFILPNSSGPVCEPG
jgi:hypothetical protein